MNLHKKVHTITVHAPLVFFARAVEENRVSERCAMQQRRSRILVVVRPYPIRSDTPDRESGQIEKPRRN